MQFINSGDDVIFTASCEHERYFLKHALSNSNNNKIFYTKLIVLSQQR
jgi:hypothetical protein